jgi:hypothetical protein
MAKTKTQSDELTKWQKKVLAASMMRIAGGIFIIFGIVIFTNMFGVARALGLTHDNVHSIFGLFLFSVGIFDAMILPNLILRQPKKKKG